MTKPLEQIQKENRKFILEAIHGCSYEEALKKEYAKKGNNTISVPFREYEGEELTLSRVLLALPKVNKENKTLDFLIAKRGWEEIGGKWFDEYKKCFIARVETIANCDCCEDFWTDVFIWSLELETLEEQTEETQRGLNKFFND